MEQGVGYRLLIVGPLESDHLRRLVLHLKMVDPEASVSVLCWQISRPLPDEVSSVLDSVVQVKSPDGILARIPLLRSLTARIRYRRAFRAVTERKPDIINIHYPSPRDMHIMPLMKKTGAKVILSPWGSDVLRVDSPLALRKLRKLYSEADHVTGLKGHFMDSVIARLGFNPGKILEVGFGSDTLDYFLEHGNGLSREQAKESWGLSGSYLITCGYNGSDGQRHKAVIESIASVRDSLPEDLVLVFPFTYGAKDGYRQELESCLERFGIKGFFVTEYLPLKRLHELRKCTDMFIHVQPTDASSASVKEYLICGAKVLHGGWIKYDDIPDGPETPFFIVPSLESLPDVILEAYRSEPRMVSVNVASAIMAGGWNSRIKDWDNMFGKLARE